MPSVERGGMGWDGRHEPWHLLDAELAHGVIHQDCHVLHGHSDVPVGPAALIRPVLSTFTLQGEKTGAGELQSLGIGSKTCPWA